jgi:curved DNA-binding protein CbpA
VQLNEAFEILSNTSTRKKYDDERANNAYKEQATEDSEQQESVKDSLKADWDLACKYKPKLSNIYKNLDKLSTKLSFSFQVLILESKQFDDASAIAKDMEITYLDNYFGPNKVIMAFAKKLVFDGYLAAAKDLNRVIKVLGKSAEANVIISQIESDYRLYSQSEEAIRERLRKKEREKQIEKQIEKQREQEVDQRISEHIKERRRADQDDEKAKQIKWAFFVIAILIICYLKNS